jgi:hypothetical protein
MLGLRPLKGAPFVGADDRTEEAGRTDDHRVIQNINEALQQKHGIHHTVIQAETQNLCGMDVLSNK